MSTAQNTSSYVIGTPIRSVNYTNWFLSQYAYPFSFPVGKGTGSISQFEEPAWTWADVLFTPQLFATVVLIPSVVVYYILSKG